SSNSQCSSLKEIPAGQHGGNFTPLCQVVTKPFKTFQNLTTETRRHGDEAIGIKDEYDRRSTGSEVHLLTYQIIQLPNHPARYIAAETLITKLRLPRIPQKRGSQESGVDALNLSLVSLAAQDAAQLFQGFDDLCGPLRHFIVAEGAFGGLEFCPQQHRIF